MSRSAPSSAQPRSVRRRSAFLSATTSRNVERTGPSRLPGTTRLEARFVPLGNVFDLDLVDGVGRWLVHHGVLRERNG